MDVRAVMSIEISDIWLEMRTAEQNQDHERMAAAIARLEHLEAATGTAQVRYASGPTPSPLSAYCGFMLGAALIAIHQEEFSTVNDH